MKRIYSIIILPLLAACSHTPADHFVLHGTVPGAMDSTEVDLQVDNRTIEPIEGYIINGKFELKGQLPIGAVYARLSMNNNGIAERKGIQEENAVKYVEANIFIENGDLTFSTPHIDSLPQSFWRYDIRRENNYTLKGSAAHDVFDRYRRATLDLQYRLRREERAAWEEKREPDAKAIAAMRSELRQATHEFIAANRHLSVNLHLAEMLEMEPFTYTQADLDAVTALFAGYTDTLPALRKFREDYRAASAYTQGKPFAGGEVYNLQGDTLRLGTTPGRYTLIDFWASWCAPCRKEGENVKAIYADFKDKGFDVLGVSLDTDKAKWQKAIEEEGYEWAQVSDLLGFKSPICKQYDINGIPALFLLDGNGKIIATGLRGDDMRKKVAEYCK